MAHPDPAPTELLLRPDLIEKVRAMAEHLRTPEGQAEVAAWAEVLRNSPEEQRLNEELEMIAAETPGWEWNGEL